MSVSLVALRLEIASEYPLISHIHFLASKVKRNSMSLSDRKEENHVQEPGKDEKLSEVYKRKHRGSRELHDISIETVTNIDKFDQNATSGAASPNQETEKFAHSSAKKEKSGSDKVKSMDSEKKASDEKEATLQALSSTKDHNVNESKSNSISSQVVHNSDLASSIHKEQKGSENSFIDVKENFQPSVINAAEQEIFDEDKTNQKEPSPALSESVCNDRRSRSLIPSQIPFFSGNHFVEVTKGILHLYKENQRTPLAEEAERSEMICMLAVPAGMTSHDLLQFTAPVSEDIEHMKIIRDAKPNLYMVLIKFKNQQSADDFYKHFNGIRFNTIEPEICHLVFVGKVETVKESVEAFIPVPGHTELPTCPVCLERMDESVEGILTILCNHSFHGGCLSKWGDTSCPVCRYCQTPELLPDNRCFGCGSQDSLWICLICGHVGCGRYVEAHAFKHYLETQHTYAMQLGNNRVWDYAGDNYVHRLLQNKADGKPVQLEPCWVEQEEKLDSMQLEYTYLLTSQLEAQRHYFENRISRIEQDGHRQLEELKEKTKQAVEERKQLEEKLCRVTKEKQSHEKKVNQLSTKLNKSLSEMKEEKEMNKCLRQNQQGWQQRLKETEKQIKELKDAKDKEVQELKDQVRDLMFYLEAQEKIQNTSEATRQEIQEGQIVVGAASPAPTGNTRHRRRKQH